MRRPLFGRPRSRLAVEIAVVLAIKTALLWALWAAFFSHPASRSLTPVGLGAHVYGPPAAASPSTETSHGSRP